MIQTERIRDINNEPIKFSINIWDALRIGEKRARNLTIYLGNLAEQQRFLRNFKQPEKIAPVDQTATKA